MDYKILLEKINTYAKIVYPDYITEIGINSSGIFIETKDHYDYIDIRVLEQCTEDQYVEMHKTRQYIDYYKNSIKDLIKKRDGIDMVIEQYKNELKSIETNIEAAKNKVLEHEAYYNEKLKSKE